MTAPAASYEAWKVSETSIPTKLSTITSWLSDCISNHERCKLSVGYLPKRLIFIGSLECPLPKIVQTTHLSSSDTKYVALSHCWGPALPIRTLKSNEAMFSKGIPFALIPQTFRDTLRIAEALGIQYVWIDALCIVQDDPLEWEVETTRMKDTYSGAILTIAASDASQSTEGCFIEHDSATESSLGTLGAGDDRNLLAFFTTPSSMGRLSSIVRIEAGDVREATKDSVLSTRGWVLQEQILSRRIVSCMHLSLHWQCMSTYKTESGATFHIREGETGSKGLPQLVRDAPNTVNDDAWRNWIANYSNRQFSFWKDRLPALSGIVQYYQEVTGDSPILGLWERSLPKDLLWVRTGAHSNYGKSFENLDIPSWSWLSCPAAVTFDLWKLTIRSNTVREVIRDHTTLVKWEVTWHGKPFTSRVKKSQLALQGPTRNISLEVSPEAKHCSPLFFNVKDESVDFGQNHVSRRCTGQFDKESVRLPSRYKCLLLRSRMHLDSKAINETFLILEPIHESQDSSYIRIGIGCFHSKSPTFNWKVSTQINLF